MPLVMMGAMAVLSKQVILFGASQHEAGVMKLPVVVGVGLSAVRLGGALGHPVACQVVVTQVVLFHNIKPSLIISRYTTSLLTSVPRNRVTLIAIRSRPACFVRKPIHSMHGDHVECRSCRLGHSVLLAVQPRLFNMNFLQNCCQGSSMESWECCHARFSWISVAESGGALHTSDIEFVRFISAW